MTDETKPGADIVADAREWLARYGGREVTHSDGCHRWHDACLIARLVAECESRTGSIDAKASDEATERPAKGANVPERERVADAEREAVEYFAAFHRSPREGDAAAAATLRALLDRIGVSDE